MYSKSQPNSSFGTPEENTIEKPKKRPRKDKKPKKVKTIMQSTP